MTDAAMAEFRDWTGAQSGIFNTLSHGCRSSEPRPRPSLPIKMADLVRQFHSPMVSVACGEVPISETPAVRSAEVTSSNSRFQTQGSRKTLPALARTTFEL